MLKKLLNISKQTIASVFTRNQTFGVYIFTSIALLLIITVGAIVSYIWLQYSKALSEISGVQMTQATKMVRENVTNYLTPASVMTELSSKIFKDGGFAHRSRQFCKVKIDPLVIADPSKEPEGDYIVGALSETEHEILESYGINLLKSFPQIAMVNIGDEQGNFMMPKRMPDGTISTKLINCMVNPFTVTWKYRDKEGNIIKKEESPYDNYDPRTRGWYKGAKELKASFWTDVYVFFSDQKPGITTSYPLINSKGLFTGVFSIDISLDKISAFLKDLKIGKTGVVYIVNKEKKLVAYPDPSYIVKKENDKFRPALIDEIGVKWVTESFNEYEKNTKNEENRFRFKSEGKNYLASFSDLSDAIGKEWTIAVVVPEDDFLGPLIYMRQVILLISFTVLFISVFIARMIASGISKPINALTDEAKKIEKFELDDQAIITHSNIKEIQMMNNSISSMKKGLKAFKKYVPSALVRQLIQTGEEAKLGGKKVELTILFTDIQGFTDISENIPPEDLMLQLFEYNNDLTNILVHHKATIDKYIGDAIMAFWGAPIPLEDHAVHACNAALACSERLKELNRKWEKEGKPLFITRFGINTGQAIVGNMGSDERMNYSILGDSVNLASRVEGVNKMYGTHLIVTQNTYEKVSDQFVFRLLDLVAVKGKKKPIQIYELMGKKNEVPDEILIFRDAFAKGLEAYLNQKWDDALKIFSSIYNRFPSDLATEVYIKRCKEFKENPPEKKWDGVARLKTK